MIVKLARKPADRPSVTTPFLYHAHEQPRTELVSGPNFAVQDPPNPDICVIEIIEKGSAEFVYTTGTRSVSGPQEAWMYTAGNYSAVRSADYQGIRILFDRYYFYYCLRPLLLAGNRSPVCSNNVVPSPVPVQFLEKKMTSLQLLFKSSDCAVPMLIRHLAHQISLEVLMAAPFWPAFDPVDLTEKEPVSGQHFSYLLEATFKRGYKVTELAACMEKSLSSFKRFFSTAYDLTPIQWLIVRRLEYAYFLWCFYDYSAETLAVLSGFGEASHFIKSFKRRFGCSPRIFKQID